ncbi:D-alanine--D-alanine ligase family protein [Geomicrobium sp. JCM 19038]|uniref:D-alanine--D-alanine ligase family protein n=1 Tax=Geomicrobium sp. JCM 19038 TaxID=1460635 RepID=UPI00045F47F8|nr:D-alanine--D-alanine ligase family protein [Geomicrobium sp. JCM 19038]GAK07867.1 D-alanine-D-alanine ligase [Geomicrobium sp. JCM 19038]
MRTRVGVFFGGISVEHEVSVISGLQAIHAMDADRYEAIPIYISKDRTWYTGEKLTDIEAYKDLKALLSEATPVIPVAADNGGIILQKNPAPRFGKREVSQIDVAFPVLHGTFGEDGGLQGLFELMNIPYVGCDVGASALGMDKVTMKQVLRNEKLPVLNDVWFYNREWQEDSASIVKRIEEEIGLPAIVKPANLGSSVGIGVARNQESLEIAIEEALEYASKLIVEPLITDLKEMNCSVLGDTDEAEASVIEEVLKTEDILSYADKYQGSSRGGSKGGSGSKSMGGGMESTDRIIPAPISGEETEQIQTLAVSTFKALGCGGVSRIDFMKDEANDTIYVNEINTIPGSLSFYLWEAADKDFQTLTNDLIQLALKRQRDRERLTFSIDSNLFSLQGGGGGKGGSKGGSKR